MLSILQAAHATVHEHGGPGVLAAPMGLRPSILSNKVNLDQTRNQLSLTEALRLQQITADHRILKAMALLLGYLVIPIENPPCSDVELLTLYARWQAHDGQTHHAIADALEDGWITATEQRTVEKAFHQAACAGLTYLQRMGGLVQ